ncbi:unnamed protein product [Umbelopsis ramanniana]
MNMTTSLHDDYSVMTHALKNSTVSLIYQHHLRSIVMQRNVGGNQTLGHESDLKLRHILSITVSAVNASSTPYSLISAEI